jgi:hypothetical protein
MATNRNLQKQPENELRDIFYKTTNTIVQDIGSNAFRPKRAVNVAVVDSLMTGIAKRLLVKGDINDKHMLKRHFDELMQNADYMAAVETGTAQEANVRKRVTLAEQAFSQIP